MGAALVSAAQTQCWPEKKFSSMWGVAASILIASFALSIGEYWLSNKDSALGKSRKQEPVKLLEGLAKTASKLKAGRRK